jgi:arginine exporter protein ArgO
VLTAFVAGIFAGYGVAIPVGAIAVLIIEMGARRGLQPGLAAGAGAATADGLYALVAAVTGVALAAALAPYVTPLRVVAVALLVLIAARGLWSLWRTWAPGSAQASADVGSGASAPAGPSAEPASGETTSGDGSAGGATPGTGVYARFLGLTLLNPMTVIYFGALIVSLPSTGESAAAKLAFVIGAFLASLSWQSVLAAFGAFLHRRAPARIRLGVSVAGYLIVLGFAARIALELLPA